MQQGRTGAAIVNHRLGRSAFRRLANVSIRARLQLLLLAVAVPFLTYFAISFGRQGEQERLHVGAQMLSAAKITASRLDDHIGDIRQLLRILTAVVATDVDNARHNDELLASFRQYLPRDINNIGVWTPSGRNIGALDMRIRDLRLNEVHRQFFEAAWNGPEMAVEAPVRAVSTGEMVGFFGLPVVRNGQTVAVVVITAKLAPLQTLLVSHGHLPAQAVVTVTDQSGIVLARSVDPGRWIGQNLKTAKSGGLEESLARREGVRFGASADGIDRVGGFTMARQVPWLVYIGLPTDIALAPVHERSFETLTVGSLLLLSSLLLASIIGRGISTPLSQLRDHAAALGRGEAVREWVDQRGEIGELAATMEAMAESLQRRTAALQTSQEQLRQITDNLPVMISLLDTRQCFRFANRMYKEWLGVEPDSLIGRSLKDLFGAEVYDHIEPHIVAGLAGQRATYERDLQTGKGTRRIEVILVPRQSPSGEVSGLFVLASDVTDAREALAMRQLSEERLSLALEASSLALFDWDLVDGQIYHSARAAVMCGEAAVASRLKPEELRRFVHPDDLAELRRATDAIKAGNADRYDVEFRARVRSGGWVWLRAKGRIVERDAAGRGVRLAGTYVDVTSRKASEERLRYLAENDSLTGLPNRVLFHDRLAQALVRCRRSGRPMALLFVDVDHFKRVNDTLGHVAGDEVLKVFARTLVSSVRACDTVARWAGDEFTLILEDLRDASDAETVAQKLIVNTRRCVDAATGVQVSASIGIAVVSSGRVDCKALLIRADAALYNAKCAGRDRYAIAA